jgi:hypothetical protein
MVIISSQNLIKITLPPRQEFVVAIVSCSLDPRFSKCSSTKVAVVLKTNFTSVLKWRPDSQTITYYEYCASQYDKGTVNSNCNLILNKLLCSKHRKSHTTEILDEIFLAVFNGFEQNKNTGRTSTKRFTYNRYRIDVFKIVSAGDVKCYAEINRP